MVEAHKSFNAQEKKNMVIKIGGVNGGGIGAVILLGGALATAALASAFVLRKNDWSSGKNRRPRPPPQVENSGEERLNEEFKNIEPEKVATELLLIEDPLIEINGETAEDAIDLEKSERFICPISPKREKNDIFNEEFLLVLSKEEDFSNEIYKESNGSGQVYIDKEMTGGETEDAEIIEISTREEGDIEEFYGDEEESELIIVDKAVEEERIDQMVVEKNLKTEMKSEEMTGGETEAVEIIENLTREEGNIEEFYCDEEESELIIVDKAVEEERIDQMVVEKNLKTEMKSEEMDLVCGNDNGENGDVKYEVEMNENESDFPIELPTVGNVEMETEKELFIEVKIEEKILEVCGNEDGEINGVKYGLDQEENVKKEAVEEHIDQMEVEKSPKLELLSDNGEICEVKYEETMDENQLDLATESELEDGDVNGVKAGKTIEEESKLNVSKVSEEETYSSLAETTLSGSLNLGAQETHLLMVLDNEQPISSEVTLSETMVSGDQKEVIQEDEMEQVEEDFVNEHIKESQNVDDEIDSNEVKSETPSENKEEIIYGNEDEVVPEGLMYSDICQPKYQEVYDDDDEIIIGETEESSETIEDEDEDEEETDLSDEEDERSSVGTQGSSSESNSEAVWPTMNLQKVNLIEEEAIREVQDNKEYDFKETTVMETTLPKKRIMVIATLSLLSTLCLIVFFTVVLLKIHGYVHAY